MSPSFDSISADIMEKLIGQENGDKTVSERSSWKTKSGTVGPEFDQRHLKVTLETVDGTEKRCELSGGAKERANTFPLVGQSSITYRRVRPTQASTDEVPRYHKRRPRQRIIAIETSV